MRRFDGKTWTSEIISDELAERFAVDDVVVLSNNIAVDGGVMQTTANSV